MGYDGTGLKDVPEHGSCARWMLFLLDIGLRRLDMPLNRTDLTTAPIHSWVWVIYFVLDLGLLPSDTVGIVTGLKSIDGCARVIFFLLDLFMDVVHGGARLVRDDTARSTKRPSLVDVFPAFLPLLVVPMAFQVNAASVLVVTVRGPGLVDAPLTTDLDCSATLLDAIVPCVAGGGCSCDGAQSASANSVLKVGRSVISRSAERRWLYGQDHHIPGRSRLDVCIALGVLWLRRGAMTFPKQTENGDGGYRIVLRASRGRVTVWIGMKI